MTTSSPQRIVDAAERVQVTLDDSEVAGAAQLLDRIAAALRRKWPAASRPEPMRSPPPGGSVQAEATPPPTAPRPPMSAGQGGAYITMLDETSTAAAESAGMLSGWSLAVKDLMAVAGTPLGAGSRVRASAALERDDAKCVAMLRTAGAHVVGTTALHEFAFGVTGVNDYTGTPINPAAPRGIPGGSSSGSAVAVADGSARLALGTDTGGSIRIPASLCGVVGFKPGFGRYTIDGVFPLSPSLDHVGLMAATVDDIDTAHRVLGRRDAGGAAVAKIGVVTRDLAASMPEVRIAVEDLIRRLREVGFELVDVVLPEAERVFAVSTAIMFSEAAAVHREMLEVAAREYGRDVRMRLIQGLAIPAGDVESARSGQAELREQVHDLMADVDCVIGPTVPAAAPSLTQAHDPSVSAALVSFTRIANVAGLPALSVPIPVRGSPIGVQLMGISDDVVLKAGAAVEALLR